MKIINKSVVKEAVCWTGENVDEIIKFVKLKAITTDNYQYYISYENSEGIMKISNSTEVIVIFKGDWIICETYGKLATCNQITFENTYSAVTYPIE